MYAYYASLCLGIVLMLVSVECVIDHENIFNFTRMIDLQLTFEV